MNYEKSCGAIVYRKFHGNTEILLIRHIKSGYWSFPKGHVEGNETEAETAIREIKEETNIDVLIDTRFCSFFIFIFPNIKGMLCIYDNTINNISQAFRHILFIFRQNVYI
mgnify:CR=1 FL=1